MTGPPPVRYARASGADIAFQQFGAGDVDVVFIHPMAQNIELAWERPEFSRMFNRFGTFSRVLHFDKRGTGASDRTLAIPTLDERVDDIRAVMDAAGVDRAVMYGVSEGGPMAILFAVSYPQRVTSLILQATSACFFPAARSDEEGTARLADLLQGADVWGTEHSILLHMFGAEAAEDPAYRAWQPRYERQSATPRAIAELLSMLEEIDVTPLLADITVPTLVVHRLGDTALPVAHAQSLAAGIPGARLVVVDGEAHFPHVGDTAAWLDAVEEFVTGLPPAPSRPTTAATPRPHAEIRTLGGFAVRRGGHDVPSSAWGSRQARQLCKRLAAAAGNPVPREQLIDMLWPDEATPLARLGARLSVQLSAVRRVLGGGVTADRTSIRIDPDAVHLDLVAFDAAAREQDDAAIVATYRGGFLPEDPYDGWTIAIRDRAQATFVAASSRLTTSTLDAGHPEQALQHALAWLAVDEHDEQAHRAVITTYLALGRQHDAQRAKANYRQRMAEIDITPDAGHHLDVTNTPARDHSSPAALHRPGA